MNQGWIVFLFLAISGVSWVFGKMKEKAEAEEAQKRARLHQQRLKQATGEGTPKPISQQQQVPIEKVATQRKQQLAQLRQERLAALREEMAQRLQGQTTARQVQPQRQQQPLRQTRPAAQQVTPGPALQQPKTGTNVATMRKPPSFSHDRAKLAKLGTHAEHADHKGEDRTVHRLITDANTTTTTTSKPLNKTLIDGVELTKKDWRRAIILNELLSPPIALRGEA